MEETKTNILMSTELKEQSQGIKLMKTTKTKNMKRTICNNNSLMRLDGYRYKKKSVYLGKNKKHIQN